MASLGNKSYTSIVNAVGQFTNINTTNLNAVDGTVDRDALIEHDLIVNNDVTVNAVAFPNNSSTYVWNWGDGTTTSGGTTETHSYSTSGTYIVKGGNVQGDTINQMSQTNVTGPLEVNNTEVTQKIIQEHF